MIAWLWARTVRSPDPSAKGALVPLVSSFMLSTKESKKAWVEPVIDPSAPDGWRFEVKNWRAKSRAARTEADVEQRQESGSSCPPSRTRNGIGSLRKAPNSLRDSQARALIKARFAVGQDRSTRPPPHGGCRRRAAAEFTFRLKRIIGDCGAAPERNVGPRGRDAEQSPMISGAGLWNDDRTSTFSRPASSSHSRLFPIWSARRGNERWRMRALRASPNDPTPLHAGGLGATAYADAVATYLALR